MRPFPPEEAWFTIVPSFVGTFVCGGLVFAALIWGRKRVVDYLFAAICLMGTIINADLSLINLLQNEETALKIDRFTYVIFVFGPAVYIHFVHAFLEIRDKRWLEISAYALGFVFSFFVFNDQFISGFNYYTFGRIAKGGILYQIFTALTAMAVLYVLSLLVRAMKHKNNVERNRIKYIIFGLGFGSLLLTLNIIPTYGYDVYPVGSMSFIPAVVLAVGILKYDLLDMGSVLRKSLTYTVLTAVLTFIYVFLATMVNVGIITFPALKNPLLPSLLSALVMVAIFDPVKKVSQKLIDHAFYRNRIDYEAALEKVSARLTSMVEEKELCRFITDWLEQVLNIEKIILCQKRGDSYQACYPPGGNIEINQSHPLISFLIQKAQPLHAYQIEKLALEKSERDSLRGFFAELNASLIVPVCSHGELLAFFALQEKKSGEVFLKEEIRFLMTIANQTAIALENARAFTEIKTWNERLEKKVEERTKELLDALREKEMAQKQMIRSESLAAIGELVAGTAHELNNPLTSAMSLLQSSMEEIRNISDKNHEELIDDLEFARKELKKAADIVRSLLDVSRQTPHYTEEVNLNHVIEDALKVLRNTIKKMDTRIVKDLDPDLPMITGNFAQLGQVFINIIKNALQALPDGKGEIFISTGASGKFVIATCADTGCGIPDELKERVFQPFFTTKEVGAGTGLGLYICHELIRRHNGTIDILDRPGGGTIIEIKIPVGR